MQVAAWRKTFRRASFRGVEFETENRDLSGGRRIVAHTYPLRDEPNPEDMGLAQRGISVSAYIFGPDYLPERDRLIAALEQEGTGEYIDPWGRTHEVVVTTYTSTEKEKTGGYVAFRINFLEAGAKKSHSTRADTAGNVRTIAGALQQTAYTIFAAEWQPGRGNAPELLATAAQAVAQKMGIPGLASAAATLQAVPQLLGQTLLGLFVSQGKNPSTLAPLWQGSNMAANPTTTGQMFAGLLELAPGTSREQTAKNTALAEAVMAGELVGRKTPARRVVPGPDAANAQALQDLLVQLALARAATCMANTAFFTADEATTTGLTLAKHLGTLRGTAAPQHYRTIADFRAALVTDTHTRAARLPELVPVNTGASLPALLHAYKLYGTAEKSAELVALNDNITHPGFVPGGATIYMLRQKKG